MRLDPSDLKQIIKEEIIILLREQTGSKTCTYSTYSWHVKKRRGVGHKQIKKLYAEVTDVERDPNEPRCSACIEDQVEINVPGAPSVMVCWVYADQVEKALQNIVSEGTFQFDDLVGYRVGKTRGAIRQGTRSVFSNHSFGTAIDINRSSNGLYRGGKRRMGGNYDPEKNPNTTIVPDGIVYQEFNQFWKWGGDLKGGLQDYMHFSITGR